jgi:hypothetical protein
MMKAVETKRLSAREQAQIDVEAEEQAANVKRFKEVLIQIQKAKRVVTNLERELEDLEHEIG